MKHVTLHLYVHVHDIQLFMYMCTGLKAHIKHIILLKISPLPSLSSKFLHRYFYLVYKPSPTMIQKKCIFSKKMNERRQTRMLIFFIWIADFPHLSALSVKYHDQKFVDGSDGLHLTVNF